MEGLGTNRHSWSRNATDEATEALAALSLQKESEGLNPNAAEFVPITQPRRSNRLKEKAEAAATTTTTATEPTEPTAPKKSARKPKVKQWRQLRHGDWDPGSPMGLGARSSGNPPPTPTREYMDQAEQPAIERMTPQPLLVILDLNGTIMRKTKFKPGHSCSAVLRPHADAFLKWLFEESDHTVMIWSSITPQNVASLVKQHFHARYTEKIIAIWARDKLRLSAAGYRGDAPVYKRLEWVWEDSEIQQCYPHSSARDSSVPDEKQRWGQHNTILIDDSCLKAVTQPYNHIQTPEFVTKAKSPFSEDKVSVLHQVKAYLQLAARWADISQYIRQSKFVFERIEHPIQVATAADDTS